MERASGIVRFNPSLGREDDSRPHFFVIQLSRRRESEGKMFGSIEFIPETNCVVIAAGPAFFLKPTTQRVVIYKNHKGEFVVSTQNVELGADGSIIRTSDEFNSGRYTTDLAEALEWFADRIKRLAENLRFARDNSHA